MGPISEKQRKTKHYVDRAKIIEIRTLVDSGFEQYSEKPMDLFNYQNLCSQRNLCLGLDTLFHQKDEKTTVQKYFFCLICYSKIRDVVSLECHIDGKKTLLQIKREENID